MVMQAIIVAIFMQSHACSMLCSRKSAFEQSIDSRATSHFLTIYRLQTSIDGIYRYQYRWPILRPLLSLNSDGFSSTTFAMVMNEKKTRADDNRQSTRRKTLLGFFIFLYPRIIDMFKLLYVKDLYLSRYHFITRFPLLKIFVEIWQLFSRKRAILVAETCNCLVVRSVGRRAICPLSLLCARKLPKIATKRPKIQPEISS